MCYGGAPGSIGFGGRDRPGGGSPAAGDDPGIVGFGGNAIIATSMAVLNAAANSQHLPLWRYLAGDNLVTLPLPEIQIFGGGAHAASSV